MSPESRIDQAIDISDPTAQGRNEDIEWVRGLREAPNSKAPWETTQSAPAAFVRGNPLRAEVKFSALTDITSITISPASTGAYGSFPETVVPITNGTGTVTLNTPAQSAPNTVDLNELTFEWQLVSYVKGGDSFAPGKPVATTRHRIYTVYSQPIAPPPNGEHWARALELSCGLAKTVQTPQGAAPIVEAMTRGIHNSSWQQSRGEARFLDPVSKLIYQPTGLTRTWNVVTAQSQKFDLENFLLYISKRKQTKQQCSDNSNVLTILLRSQGVDASQIFIANAFSADKRKVFGRLPDTQYFGAGIAAQQSAQGADAFGFHQVCKVGGLVYDPTLRPTAAGDPYMGMTETQYLPTALGGPPTPQSVPVTTLAVDKVTSSPLFLSSIAPSEVAVGETTKVTLSGSGLDGGVAGFAVFEAGMTGRPITQGITIHRDSVTRTHTTVTLDLTFTQGFVPRGLVLAMQKLLTPGNRKTLSWDSVPFSVVEGGQP